jgi:hypothetical protein
MTEEPLNPYAAPVSDIGPVQPPVSDAARIRREHIAHETSLKNVGILYYVGGLFAAFVVIGFVIMFFSQRRQVIGPQEFLIMLFVTGIYGAIGALLFVSGYGMRRLQRWVKIPAGFLSGLGLLAVPCGTLINGYILYLIFSRKGTVILSEEYQEIIRQTPGTKCKTSPVTLAIALVLLAVLVATIAWTVLRSSTV